MQRAASTIALGVLLSFAFGVLPAHAASVTVDIPESYATVTAGERLYFQVNFLYPENDRRRDFRISYHIWEGETEVASAEFLKAVETQASFTDYTVIPEIAKSGLHTLQVDIYDDTGKAVAQKVYRSFQVKAQYDWLTTYFSILLAAILAVGLVIVFEVRRALWRMMTGRR
jgi:hypothetical protein